MMYNYQNSKKFPIEYELNGDIEIGCLVHRLFTDWSISASIIWLINQWIVPRIGLYLIHWLIAHASSSGDQGWGLLSQFAPFGYFPIFQHPKYILAIEYHVHIWQVSLQFCCGDICQIWMWYKESNRYFNRIENFACGEINGVLLHPPTTHPTPGWIIDRCMNLSLCCNLSLHQTVFVNV